MNPSLTELHALINCRILENNHPLFTNSAGEIALTVDGEACLRLRPGTRSLAEFKALLESFLLLVRRLATGKALVDQRALAPLSRAEQAWLQDHWLPRAVVQGRLTYGSILPAYNPQAQASVAAVWQTYNATPQVRLFAHEDEANAWLRERVVIYSQM